MGRTGIALVGLVTAACGLSVVGLEPLGGEPANDAEDASSSSSAVDGASSFSSSSSSTSGSGAASSTSSSGNDPVDAAREAAPPPGPIFGDDCPTGTTYLDDFSTDPKGRWIDGHATWTWNQQEKTFTVTGYDDHGVIWIGPRPKWVNYSVEMEIKVGAASLTGANAGAFFRIMNFGTPPLTNNEGQMFLAAVVVNGDDDVIFGTENDGWTQNNQVNDGNTPANTWLRLRAEANGSAIKIYTNDQKRLDVSNNKFGSGSIGIKTYGLALSVRRVEVKCL